MTSSVPSQQNPSQVAQQPSSASSTKPSSVTGQAKLAKARELHTSTLRSPRFAYAQLALDPGAGAGVGAEVEGLDAVQVRTYCVAALRRFLGDTGAGVGVDVLAVEGRECWVRVARPDLGAFTAALTAFSGLDGSDVADGGNVSTPPMLLRLRACGDWLGALLGRADEKELWGS